MDVIAPGSIIGIIGGGQLGRMITLAAANLGYHTHIYCPEDNSPAMLVSAHKTVAPYTDEAALESFAQSVDTITYEFENIPHASVEILSKYTQVHPHWELLHLAQNRLREKNFCQSLGIGTARFAEITDRASLSEALADLDNNAILKTCELGYDGKGQYSLSSQSDIDALPDDVFSQSLILEQRIPFTKEISVIIARREDGTHACFPIGENVHKEGILHTTTVPAEIDSSIADKATKIAITLAEKIGLVGLLAVECFITEDNDVLVNEMAPRPHNSGHWTMDGCITSQFEQMVRAICGLPLGPVTVTHPTVMYNLIGNDIDEWQTYLHDPSVKLHLYGKAEARKGRKMGHINRIRD